MQSERIIKILGKFVYANLFDYYPDNEVWFAEKDFSYKCEKIFWRFFWVIKKEKI